MEQVLLSENALEREILSRDLISFLDYVRIPDPPPYCCKKEKKN